MGCGGSGDGGAGGAFVRRRSSFSVREFVVWVFERGYFCENPVNAGGSVYMR